MGNHRSYHGASVEALTLPAIRPRSISVQAVLLFAASFLLPAAAHAIGMPVRLFLPMHWPVVLVGLCYGWRSGVIVGAAAPTLSYLLSGMPLPAILPSMTAELAAYGLVAGVAREMFRLNAWIATALSLVIGRVVFLAFALSTGAIAGSIPTYLKAAMLPGLVAGLAQLLLLPIVARWWVKREAAK